MVIGLFVRSAKYKDYDRAIPLIVAITSDDGEADKLTQFSSHLLIPSFSAPISSPPFLHILLGKRQVVEGEWNKGGEVIEKQCDTPFDIPEITVDNSEICHT